MALTNIELYEALKRDLNEDAARMIAEVIPKAEDLATKGDISALELRLIRRIGALERRLYAFVLVPFWAAAIGAIAKGVFG
jgi:hypothetical protein